MSWLLHFIGLKISLSINKYLVMHSKVAMVGFIPVIPPPVPLVLSPCCSAWVGMCCHSNPHQPDSVWPSETWCVSVFACVCDCRWKMAAYYNAGLEWEANEWLCAIDSVCVSNHFSIRFLPVSLQAGFSHIWLGALCKLHQSTVILHIWKMHWGFSSINGYY